MEGVLLSDSITSIKKMGSDIAVKRTEPLFKKKKIRSFVFIIKSFIPAHDSTYGITHYILPQMFSDFNSKQIIYAKKKMNKFSFSSFLFHSSS